MADRDHGAAATLDAVADSSSDVSNRSAPPHRWRLFALLVGACALGAAAVAPYSLALLPKGRTPVPLPAIVAATVVQTSVLAAIATACGLWLGPRVGLGAPMIRPSEAPLARRAALTLGAGLFMGVLILALEAFVFAPLMPNDLSAEPGQRVSPWMALLASVYGAIDEEVLLRLGVMTFLAWVVARLSGGRTALPSPLMWACVVAAVLLFGAGHLPALAAMTPLSRESA
jgi:hypothetical protein